jgi:hypothetical protein
LSHIHNAILAIPRIIIPKTKLPSNGAPGRTIIPPIMQPHTNMPTTHLVGFISSLSPVLQIQHERRNVTKIAIPMRSFASIVFHLKFRHVFAFSE